MVWQQGKEGVLFGELTNYPTSKITSGTRGEEPEDSKLVPLDEMTMEICEGRLRFVERSYTMQVWPRH